VVLDNLQDTSLPELIEEFGVTREQVADRRSGAWVFRDTRTPVSGVFDNLGMGASISEIMAWFHLSHEQIVAVIEFDAKP
jgi:uncharacterized protein (DUF433 family)